MSDEPKVLAQLTPDETEEGRSIIVQLNALDENMASVMREFHRQRALLLSRSHTWWSAMSTKYEFRHHPWSIFDAGTGRILQVDPPPTPAMPSEGDGAW